MAILSPGRPGLRIFSIRDFSGGLSTVPQADNEFEYFQNWDNRRDGYAIQRNAMTKINSNSIGTGMAVGMKVVAAGGNNSLVVAKPGTTWYAAVGVDTLTLPAAFTSFTVPASPGDNAVHMESVSYISGALVVNAAVFVAEGMAPIQWDGINPATAIPGAPSGAKYARWHNNRLWLAGYDAYSIRASERGDITSWPLSDNNEFASSARLGKVTGLEVHGSSLIIFSQRGVQALDGDCPSYFVRVMHDQIGCTLPNTISTLGNATVFATDADVYQLAGDITILSDKIQGRKLLVANDIHLNWGALTPFYYVMNVNANTSAASPKAPTDGPAYVTAMSRRRPGVWVDWQYPVGSDVGAKVPYQATIAMLDNIRMVIGSGLGDVYVQYIRQSDMAFSASPSTAEIPPMGLDDTSSRVYAALRTRRFDFGDPNMMKRLRRINVRGVGFDATVIARLWGNDHLTQEAVGLPAGQWYDVDTNVMSTTFYSEVTKTAQVLPLEFNMSIDTDVTTFSILQLDVIGTSMQITGIDIFWEPVRFSSLWRVGV